MVADDKGPRDVVIVFSSVEEVGYGKKRRG